MYPDSYPGLTLALARAADRRGEAPALIDGETVITWHAYRDRVARLAGALAGMGVQAGDRVAVLSPNTHRLLESLFAALWAGGVAVPLNHRLAAPELAAQANDCTPVVLVVDPAFRSVAETLRARVPSLRHIIVADDNYERLLTDAAPIPDQGARGDDTAFIIYTGGTTGRAKGVMLTHANLWANTANALAAVPLDGDSTHLHVAPLFHVAAIARAVSATVLGTTQVLLAKFDPAAVLAAIQQHRVVIVLLVPTMLRVVADLPGFHDYDTASLRMIAYGASPIDETLLRRLIKLFPHVALFQAYGMTELSPTATQLGPEHHVFDGPNAGRLRSAGRAAMLAEVRVVDDADVEQPTGAVGEIVVRGPTVMKGYWNQPEVTAHTLRGGWMHTGDLGYLDADGFLFLVDRKNDMIISGGENVHTTEVENAVASHPAVADCAVIGIPDPRWGQVVHAVIVPRPGETPDLAAIQAHCRALIAGYKIPRSLELRTAPLPLSGANKVLKSKLREEWAARAVSPSR